MTQIYAIFGQFLTHGIYIQLFIKTNLFLGLILFLLIKKDLGGTSTTTGLYFYLIILVKINAYFKVF